MRDKRNALVWALGWWFLRRKVKRRVASVRSGASDRRRGGLLGLLVVAGIAAGAFVAWRRLSGEDAESGSAPGSDSSGS